MPKKIITIVVCLVVGLLVLAGGKLLYDTAKYKKIVSELEISTPDLSQIENGDYTGFFDVKMISAGVTVTVQDHMITNIVIIEHKNGRGAAAENITEDVILHQSLDVDMVSGATGSSKVILKAIETALTGQIGC